MYSYTDDTISELEQRVKFLETFIKNNLLEVPTSPIRKVGKVAIIPAKQLVKIALKSYKKNIDKYAR